MDANGSNQRQLTNNGHININPAWSPDGKHIVFQSWQDKTYQIYIMDADGSNPRNLTNNNFYNYTPAWSSR
jgi:TolB protein